MCHERADQRPASHSRWGGEGGREAEGAAGEGGHAGERGAVAGAEDEVAGAAVAAVLVAAVPVAAVPAAVVPAVVAPAAAAPAAVVPVAAVPAEAAGYAAAAAAAAAAGAAGAVVVAVVASAAGAGTAAALASQALLAWAVLLCRTWGYGQGCTLGYAVETGEFQSGPQQRSVGNLPGPTAGVLGNHYSGGRASGARAWQPEAPVPGSEDRHSLRCPHVGVSRLLSDEPQLANRSALVKGYHLVTPASASRKDVRGSGRRQ